MNTLSDLKRARNIVVLLRVSLNIFGIGTAAVAK